MRVLRMFAVSAAVSAAIATLGWAGVPDPAHSSTDGNFMLGNARGGFMINAPGVPPATLDGYNVTVRDVNNIPLAGVVVSFNLPSGTLRAMSTQQFGQSPNCPSNTISAVTNGSGQAVIVPAVTGSNQSVVPTVQVRANGVLLTTIIVRTCDMVCEPTSTGIVSLSDLNMFRQHYSVGQPFYNQPAGDFNNDGVVDLTDLNIFRTEYLCGSELVLPLGSICVQTQCSPCP